MNPKLKVMLTAWLIFFNTVQLNCWASENQIISLEANNIGVIAKTYAVIEKDLGKVLLDRLEKLANSDEIQQAFEDTKDKVVNYLMKPSGIELPEASQYQRYPLNTTFTASQAITDNEGKVIVAEGETSNILDEINFDETLCFVDGSKPSHLDWALIYCDHPQHKIILTNGEYLGNLFKLDKKLFFDQYGALSKHFHIPALPAVIRQQGSQLYVEVFPPQ